MTAPATTDSSRLAAKPAAERLKRQTGVAAGPDHPRWPGAPDPADVPVDRMYECPNCPKWSTLSYRCSECGHDLADHE